MLDIGESDFRDPKVFWHEETQAWVMVVALATQKRVQFYGSPNLKEWTLLSEFGPAGIADKANWECPDLFELPIENESGKTRWVLEADMGSGSIAGGSGGEYFTGEFDGERFVADSLESQGGDYGRDFYAPVSWSNIPPEDGRRIWIGWMNNWETSTTPAYPWRGAMSIPRELTLRRIDGRLRLCQQPVREVASLRGRSKTIENVTLDNETLSLQPDGKRLEILVDVAPESATSFGLRVFKGKSHQTETGYDPQREMLYVDRTQSSDVSFHPAFPGRHLGPLSPHADGRIQLRILVDECSVEVFGGDGQTVITDLVFPDFDSNGVDLFATDGTCCVISCKLYEMESVWHDQVAAPAGR